MPYGLIKLFTGSKTIYIVRNLNLTRDILILLKKLIEMKTPFFLLLSVLKVSYGYDGSDRNPRHICHPVTSSAQVN